jgi:hypothetical protein
MTSKPAHKIYRILSLILLAGKTEHHDLSDQRREADGRIRSFDKYSVVLERRIRNSLFLSTQFPLW